MRFSTSVLFSLSIGVELLTPAFPQYFLLLATVANIAKQISLACYLATSVSLKALNSLCFNFLCLNVSFKLRLFPISIILVHFGGSNYSRSKYYRTLKVLTFWKIPFISPIASLKPEFKIQTEKGKMGIMSIVSCPLTFQNGQLLWHVPKLKRNQIKGQEGVFSCHHVPYC